MPTPTTGLMREARNLTLRIGRRGACLLFLAMLDLIYSLGLLTPTERTLQSPTIMFLTTFMPLWWWAIIWGTVGTICLIYAFQQKDSVAFGCAIALKAFWGLILGLGWLIGYVERGYLSTAIWGAFALFILVISGWRENNEH